MALTQAIATGSLQLFKLRLLGRMQVLARESGEAAFCMPVALLLLADEPHGGAVRAEELVQRFNLSDFESRNLFDFFFPGWSAAGAKAKGIAFDLRSLAGFRQALRAAGVHAPEGHAELVLVDAGYVQGAVRLNFAQAVRIDLAAAREGSHFASMGAFLQSMVDAVELLKAQGRGDPGAAFTLNGRLGLAVARKSLLGLFVDRWDSLLGAGKLAGLVVRGLGPDLPLIEL
jgi:hypothetical protein